MPITPDTKDWTWVLERPCPGCGFDPAAVSFRALPALLGETASRWAEVLSGDGERIRPDDATWSPLEYGAHMRDVCRVFAERFALMLAEDDPQFANWDQDAAAVAERYNEQRPAIVAAELTQAAQTLATLLGEVPDAALTRTGRRGDGARFTVDSLGAYLAHEAVHHVWDVTGER
ncbi:DinB family protein [Microbacterium sp. STN6]|uniref:DinB family protein n=1 Tax=Microbacterium sp. STN6 TaxID=2995588 RepID=UPI002260C8FC|nr:DinB family protein [Microbacterium sp. STN6]MCX7522824.1 DinB family protein [Microbacterium sp. STN6]